MTLLATGRLRCTCFIFGSYRLHRSGCACLLRRPISLTRRKQPRREREKANSADIQIKRLPAGVQPSHTRVKDPDDQELQSKRLDGDKIKCCSTGKAVFGILRVKPPV